MKKIDGYIAAPFSPMTEDGELNLDLIPAYASYLLRNGLDGVFVCGSTGEGALLGREERMILTESWLDASKGKLKVVVHTGGCNLKEQELLARHAGEKGAWAVAAMAPAFLSPGRKEELVGYCRTIAAAAPGLPFYYYHIPALNGVQLSVLNFLEAASEKYNAGLLDAFSLNLIRNKYLEARLKLNRLDTEYWMNVELLGFYESYGQTTIQ